MIGANSGARMTFGTGEIRDTRPNVTISTGSTAICAARVSASGSPSQPGSRCSRVWSAGARNRMPAVARTES